MKKVILTDILLLEIKGKEHQKKTCKFIRTNTSKDYDANHKIGRTQTFISKLKNKHLKKLEKESSKKTKELEDKTRKLKLQLTSQSAQ